LSKLVNPNPVVYRKALVKRVYKLSTLKMHELLEEAFVKLIFFVLKYFQDNKDVGSNCVDL